MIWNGNYDDLKNFLHSIKTKHATVKFDFVISKETVSFLDTKVYIHKDPKIQSTFYPKETVCQSFLHSKSENSLCLKKLDV